MTGCFERIPYASVIACLFVSTGTSIMCWTNYEGFRRTSFIFNEYFFPIDCYKAFQTAGIVVTGLTILLSLMDVSFGAMMTGETRHKLYPHKKARSGGRSYAKFLSLLTYLLTGCWVLVFILFAIPVSLWAMLHSVCYQETEYWRRLSADKDETHFSYTFNLTTYGLYHRPLDTSLYSESINSPSAFTQLCQEISTIGPMFTISFLSSFLVILGLLGFIACLANASVRLELGHELDLVRQLPNAQDDIVMPLISSQSPHSHMDMQPNTFSYMDTTSSNVYHHYHPMPVSSASFALDSMHNQSSGFGSLIRS